MKKYLKRIAYTLLFIAGLRVIYSGLDFIFCDDTQSQTRLTFNDFYNEGDIDYLFSGTSHSTLGIDAAGISRQTGKEVFSLSITDMDFVGGYFLLKEAVRAKEIDHIFYELSISRFNIHQETESSAYIISDYIRFFPIKARYLITAFEPEQYVNGFLRVRRSIDPVNTYGLGYFVDLYKAKTSPDYWSKENYGGKGWWPVEKKWSRDDTRALYVNTRLIDPFTAREIAPLQWEYMMKIVDLCKKEGIDLTFYVMPCQELFFAKFSEAERITKLARDELTEKGACVIDLNRVKEEYLSLSFSDFYNPDHLSRSGAEKVSAFLAEYIKEPGKDYFYPALSEKYPEREGVLAAGYDRTFITDRGRYRIKKDARGRINRMEIDIFAMAYFPVPAKASLMKIARDEEREKWITGETVDDYTTRFTLPFDDSETGYIVLLTDPDSGEELYRTTTFFDMT